MLIENTLLKKENHFENNNFKDAEDHYLKLLDDDENNVNALFELGKLFYSKEDLLSALIFIEKAYRIESSNLDIAFTLADLYSDLNRFKDQENIYNYLGKIYSNNDLLKARKTVLSHLSKTQNEFSKRENRIDYFIIWGNGFNFKNEILSIIRENNNFDILSISDHKLDDIQSFVFKLYETDPVPWEHLVAKTKYLMTSHPEITVIIVNNKKLRERYFGEGEFRHIQCENIKIIKEEIRNKYNPKINGKRSEEHVIHASDYEVQTQHLLNILELGTIDNYKVSKNRFINIPVHLPVIKSFTIKMINIDDVYCSIIDGDLDNWQIKMLKITDTPHYNFVNGKKDEYQKYHEKYGGQLLKDDHSEEAFTKLISEFDYEKYLSNNNYILLERLGDKNYKIIDGVHRAAILKFENKNKIIAAIVNNNY